MEADWKVKQREAEQAMGRLYNARNAAAEHVNTMRQQGIDVKTVFYTHTKESSHRLPPDQWRVQMGDELFTMDEFYAMMVLMGYIK